MFVMVGRFHFRSMNQDQRQALMQQIEKDVRPILKQSPGFRGVRFLSPTADEVMTSWLWDSEADWTAAFDRLGPFLKEYVVPNLVQPPDRFGGEVVLEIMP